VLIDGNEVGRLRQSDTGTYAVEPGGHEVMARIDWLGSPALSIEIPVEGVVRLECGPAGGMAQVFLAIFSLEPYLTLEVSN
jgi:hypothetical protein